MNDHNDILGPGSSPETDKLTAALCKAQSEYPVVKLDSSNPHFKSKFASYQQCCESLRGPLNKNGLALPDFRPGYVAGQWVVIGTLRHTTGQWIQGIAPLVNPKQDMQGFGAAMTYAKRTLLMALTGGFAGEQDDDGNSVAPQSNKPPFVNAGASLAYETGAKKAIAEAETIEEARKALDTVKLRAKERKVAAEVYRRCEAEFDKVWNKEEE